MTESHASVDAVRPETAPPAKRSVPSLPAPAPIGNSGSKIPFYSELILFGLVLIIPFLAFGDSRYWLPIFTRLLALAMFAMAVDLVWGYTGLLSLGQGLYFGLGAYAMGYCLKMRQAALDAGLPPGTPAKPDFMIWCRLPEVPPWITPLANVWVALAVAVILPTLLAAVFGTAVFRMRIKGVFFSLLTQALVLAVFTLVDNQQPYTGGRVGMPGMARLELFGHMFADPKEMYLMLAGCLTVCFLGCLWLVHSKFGKVLTAIRDNETRTLALGYNTAMYKSFVFAFAGALSGFAGALYTAAQRTVGPTEVLDIAFSIEVVILVAVGGRGTLVGAVLGTMLVTAGKTYVNNEFKQGWPLILGGLFIAVVLFLPEGILGGVRKLAARMRRSGEPDVLIRTT
jgi:urea transport system permease protein